MGWIIFGGVWFACMVLGYGLSKGNFRNFCEKDVGEKYNILDELVLLFCLIIAAPIVLCLAHSKRASVQFVGTKAFCFRMPDHCKTSSEKI